MMRKLLIVFTSVLLCLSLSCFTFAAQESSSFVNDDVGIFTIEQKDKLENKAKEISNEYGIEVYIHVTDSLHNMSKKEFAKTIFVGAHQKAADVDDGIVIVYKDGNVGNRELYLYANGRATDAFDSDDKEDVYDVLQKYIEKDQSYKAFEKALGECEKELQDEFGPPSVEWYWIPLSLIIAFVIAFIIAKVQASKLKSVHRKVGANTYVRDGSMVLTAQHDIYLYRTVIRRVIESNTNRGGSRGGSDSGRSF